MTSAVGQTQLRPLPVKPIAPGPFTGASTSGSPSMVSASGQTRITPVPPKPVAPSPFSGMTSSANVGTRVPQPSPAPFTPISQGTMTKTAPYTEVPGITPEVNVRRGGMAAPPVPEGQVASKVSKESSLLSRGRTLYQLGEEPDLNNPTHVKLINDLQTRSGPQLRTMANAGDRFAAFVLRHMPRP